MAAREGEAGEDLCYQGARASLLGLNRSCRRRRVRRISFGA